MDALYWLCVVVSGSALVLISALIPWGGFTRYVLNSTASWPEPMAILLTFVGAAACYRADTHMRVSILVRAMSREADMRVALGSSQSFAASPRSSLRCGGGPISTRSATESRVIAPPIGIGR